MLSIVTGQLNPWHAQCNKVGMLPATHLQFYRVHTTVWLTMGVALATIASFVASLILVLQ